MGLNNTKMRKTKTKKITPNTPTKSRKESRAQPAASESTDQQRESDKENKKEEQKKQQFSSLSEDGAIIWETLEKEMQESNYRSKRNNILIFGYSNIVRSNLVSFQTPLYSL